MMRAVWPALHTGTHAGVWGAVEVLFALAVLAVAVALVAALLGRASGTPEARLVAAFARSGERDRRRPSGRNGGRSLDERGE